MVFVRRFLSITGVCLFMTIYLMGCASLHEVSPYDAETYKQAAAVNKKVRKFFVKVTGADDEHRKYKHHKTAYEEILTDLMVLLARAQARKDNDMTKSVMICVIDWRSLISAHKGDSSKVVEIRKPLGSVDNPKVLDNAQVQKVYADLLYINTAATHKQMETKLSDGVLTITADTFLQNFYNLMGTEFDKKEK